MKRTAPLVLTVLGLALGGCGGEDPKAAERQRVCDNLAADSGRYTPGTDSFKARVEKCVRDLERIVDDGG
jgi:hypothetical protein